MSAGEPDPSRESDRADGLPHPRETAALFGHPAAERMMLDAYRAGRLHHAWLIGGPRGIGKATLAWRFARFVQAYQDPADPAVQNAGDLTLPEAHPIWRRVRSGALGDVAVLRRRWNDKAKKFYTVIRVDEVREAMGLFQTSAAAGGYRICIIDSAEDLNASSANALLKVIEEPPPASLFLIVAHRPSQVMPTILSRCRRLMLGPLDPAALRGAVAAAGVDLGDLTAADLDAVMARAGGSVARVLEALDPARLTVDRELRAQFDRLPALDWQALHRLADRLGGLEGGAALMLDAVLDHIDAAAAAAARAGADGRSLAPLAEVWEKVRAAAREAEALNLDQRPLLLSIFADLAQATRGAGLR